ncbi:unnamed protein product [Mucor hiemalis]
MRRSPEDNNSNNSTTISLKHRKLRSLNLRSGDFFDFHSLGAQNSCLQQACLIRWTQTSPLYYHLSDQKYVEITTEVTQLFNQNWTFFPQLRYATSQIFTGAILVNKTSALLLNCIEPYGRSKTVDAHHECRIGNAMNTPSFPKKQPNYGWINIITTQEDGATKLKIGTTISNLLLTSSIRIDKNLITKNIVELGSATSNFTATNDTKIYLNTESSRLGKM